jgi:hypothetical protein
LTLERQLDCLYEKLRHAGLEVADDVVTQETAWGEKLDRSYCKDGRCWAVGSTVIHRVDRVQVKSIIAEKRVDVMDFVRRKGIHRLEPNCAAAEYLPESWQREMQVGAFPRTEHH